MTCKRSLRLLMPLCLIALALAPATVLATPIPIPPDGGILALGPMAGTLVAVTSVPTCINWGGGNTCVPGTTHQMSVNGSSVLFVNGSTPADTIKDLAGGFPPPTLPMFETVQGGATVGNSIINFDLTQVVTNGPTAQGNCGSDAPLNTCTPANSPFTFNEDITGTKVTIKFTVFLNAYTGSTTTGVTPYSGEFDTTLSGNLPVNPALGACSGVKAGIVEILTCEANGGTVTASWTANESPNPVPEPMSFALLGVGLVGLAFVGRRRRRA